MTLSLTSATIVDFEEEWKIYTHYFGDAVVGRREDCLELLQCPYGCWTLKDSERVVGGFSLFRLSEDFLKDILTGQRQDNEITLRNILPLEKGKPLSLYLAIAAVDPLLAAPLRLYYAGRLAASFAALQLTFRKLGYMVEAIYCLAVTPEGKQVARKMGFTPLNLPSCTPEFVPYRYLMDQRGVQRLSRLSRFSPQLHSNLLITPAAAS